VTVVGSPPDDGPPLRHGLDLLVETSRIVVCAGSGGVGKTTTAAALAAEGARRARRAVVVTIDPARRLADALGLGKLTNEPRPVSGPWPPGGSLHALQLDTKTTFDELVGRYAANDAQRRRILGNRFYRNISNALSGTQEYMAAEKLYALHEAAGFDLIVVDTPPSRNALDVLDAPNQLARLLDHRVYRLLTRPSRGVGRVVNRAAQSLLRHAARAVGSEVIDDAVAFFSAFEGMEQGFRERSQRVQALLGSGAAAFVLVASPRDDTVGEALHFARRLDDQGLTVEGLVVNRVHPPFGGGAPGKARSRAAEAGGAVAPLGALWSNLAAFRAVAEREEESVAVLAERVAPAPMVRVPLLDDDVHDLGGLLTVASHLFAAGPKAA
jgi:anion-transporting  ArsA/GET3 family ATPase